MTMYYTETHEWVEKNGDELTVGLARFALEQLGDLVYIELPEEGTEFETGDECATVESVKAASEVYAPVCGVITAVNTALADEPASGSSEDEKSAWLFKMTLADASELDNLLSAEAYQAQLD